MAKAKKAPPDVHEIRRRNFKLLKEQWGTFTNLAKQLGITPGYASQLASGFRPFTEKSARKLEQKLGLSVGWIDQERHTTPTRPRVESDKLFHRALVLCTALTEESGKSIPLAKFSDIVNMVYEEAQRTGTLSEPYVKQLLKLME